MPAPVGKDAQTESAIAASAQAKPAGTQAAPEGPLGAARVARTCAVDVRANAGGSIGDSLVGSNCGGGASRGGGDPISILGLDTIL